MDDVYTPQPKRSKYTEAEDLTIWRYLIEKPVYPTNWNRTWDEFIAASGSHRNVKSLKMRWHKTLLPQIYSTQFEDRTKLELLKKLRVPVNNEEFVRTLETSFTIDFDETKCISHYAPREQHREEQPQPIPPIPIMPVLKRSASSVSVNLTPKPKIARLEEQEEQDLMIGEMGDIGSLAFENSDERDLEEQVVVEQEHVYIEPPKPLVQNIGEIIVPVSAPQPPTQGQPENSEEIEKFCEAIFQKMMPMMKEQMEPWIQAVVEKNLRKEKEEKKSSSMKKFLLDMQNLLENQNLEIFNDALRMVNQRLVEPNDVEIPHEKLLIASKIILDIFNA